MNSGGFSGPHVPIPSWRFYDYVSLTKEKPTPPLLYAYISKIVKPFRTKKRDQSGEGGPLQDGKTKSSDLI